MDSHGRRAIATVVKHGRRLAGAVQRGLQLRGPQKGQARARQFRGAVRSATDRELQQDLWLSSAQKHRRVVAHGLHPLRKLLDKRFRRLWFASEDPKIPP